MKASRSEEREIARVVLGDGKWLSVSVNDRGRIELREWFLSSDGSPRPGRNGMAFRLSTLIPLAGALNALADALRRPVD